MAERGVEASKEHYDDRLRKEMIWVSMTSMAAERDGRELSAAAD